jgi:transposase
MHLSQSSKVVQHRDKIGGMSKRLNFTLNEEQLAEIEQAINGSAYPEVRQRAIALRLLHLGQSPEQVAQAVMVTSNTIYAWHKRWREQGIAGLRDGQRSGRPTKADESYIKELERVLDRDPRTLGLPFTIWTLNRLRLYLAEQTDILLSYTRFRALMSREGYRWKTPKHDLSHLQDRPAQETAAQVMEWLKKTSPLTPSPTLNSSLWTKQR